MSRIYEELLFPSFPADELADRDYFVQSWRRGAIHVTALADDVGNPVSVAIGWQEGVSGVVLLEWLAVRPDARGSGAGGAVLRRALDTWDASLAPPLIVGEVEHPSFVSACPAHGNPAKRVHFYEKAGARALDVPYFQPPIREGGARVPLMLVAFRVDGGAPDTTVPAVPLRSWLEHRLVDEPRDRCVDEVFRSVAGDEVPTFSLGLPPEMLPCRPTRASCPDTSR